MSLRATPLASAPARGAVSRLGRYLPAVGWIGAYRRGDAVGDLMAGLIVTIMLVPQAMAYAMLAGLPPQVGLYASVTPMLVYAALGSSRYLSVGPVAMDSLLVAAALGALAPQGAAEYVALALLLALMVGLIELGLGLARLGFLINFLSQPVISGFTSAAALVIALSQLKHLLGVSVPSTGKPYEVLAANLGAAAATNPVTLAVGAASIAALLFFGGRLGALLARRGVPEVVAEPIARGGPLVAVVASAVAVWALGLDAGAGVKIVGEIPAGLPPITAPPLGWHQVSALAPSAAAIALIAIMEAISTATALAGRRREKIDPNQELVALGAANVGAAFTGGYPVTGGLSRSVVNFAAGANTNLASVITAGLITLTVMFLMPLFYYLPQATLAAVIVVAVAKLVDFGAFRRVWSYSKADGVSLIATFAGVLLFDIAAGIGIGAVVSIALHLWRTSRPHMAVVGRVGESEHFRNVRRHEVKTCPQVLAIRVDEALYFANAKYLETSLLGALADRPEIKHLVLICSGVNWIDASALETLERLLETFRESGIEVRLAEIKGPVMDRLERSGFVERLGRERVYLSTHEALRALGC